MKNLLLIARTPILICAALLLAGTVHAQYDHDASVAPENDAIMMRVLDAHSPYHYPSLFSRYMAGDTTLNLEDYRHLYYGFAWQPQYKPFESAAGTTLILNILSKGLDMLTEEDCRKIVEYGTDVMKTEPFNPSTINYLTYAYGQLGDTINERINSHRFRMLIQTIRSSGTGVKENSPWHVLYFSHVNDVMGHLGTLYGKRMVVSRTTEFVPLMERRGRTKGYYFNFERIYWFKPEDLPEKRSAGWEINGIPLRKRR